MGCADREGPGLLQGQAQGPGDCSCWLREQALRNLENSAAWRAFRGRLRVWDDRRSEGATGTERKQPEMDRAPPRASGGHLGPSGWD